MSYELGSMLTGKFPDLNLLNLVTANPTFDNKKSYSYRGNAPSISPHRKHFIEHGGGVVSIPRNYYKLDSLNIVDRTEPGRKIAITFNAQPRKYQADFMATFRPDVHDYILNMDCGTGKTFTAIYQVAKLAVNTIIIVPSRFLGEQWQVEVCRFTDPAEEWVNEFTWLTGITPHIVKSSKEWFNGHDVVIMTYQMAAKLPAERFSEFGCVVMDEVHRAGAGTYHDILSKIPARHRIGLTATPDREDDAHHMLFKHFQLMYRMPNPFPKASLYFVNTGYTVNTKMVTGYTGIDTAAAFDSKRTLDLHSIVSDCMSAGRKVLILSKRIEALRDICAKYPNSGLVISENAKIKGYIKQIRSGQCNPIGGIMQLAKEGMDIDSIDTVIFHLPVGDLRQPVGRILRLLDGKKTPLALALNDDIPAYRKVWVKAMNTGGHFNYKGEVNINQVKSIL